MNGANNKEKPKEKEKEKEKDKEKDKQNRMLNKKQYSQKIDHVVKKHDFQESTFLKPTWCMYYFTNFNYKIIKLFNIIFTFVYKGMLCSKFIYGLRHQGLECRGNLLSLSLSISFYI